MFTGQMLDISGYGKFSIKMLTIKAYTNPSISLISQFRTDHYLFPLKETDVVLSEIAVL